MDIGPSKGLIQKSIKSGKKKKFGMKSSDSKSTGKSSRFAEFLKKVRPGAK